MSTPTPFVLIDGFPGKSEFLTIDSLRLTNNNVVYIAKDFPNRRFVLYIVDWAQRKVIHFEDIVAAPFGFNGGGLVPCINGRFYVVWWANSPIQMFAQLRNDDGKTYISTAAIPGIDGSVGAYIPPQNAPFQKIAGCAASVNDECWIFINQITGAGLLRSLRAVWIRSVANIGSVIQNVVVETNSVTNVDVPVNPTVQLSDAGFALCWWRITGTTFTSVLQVFAWTGLSSSPKYTMLDANSLYPISRTEGILVPSSEGTTFPGVPVDVICQKVTFAVLTATFGATLFVTSLTNYAGWEGATNIVLANSNEQSREFALMWQLTGGTRTTQVVTINFDSFTLVDNTIFPTTVELLPNLNSVMPGDFVVDYTFRTGLTSLFGLFPYTISRVNRFGTPIIFNGYAIEVSSCAPCVPTAPVEYNEDGWKLG